MKIFSNGVDIPELVSVENDPRDGAEEEDEDDDKEDELFDGTAETQMLTMPDYAMTAAWDTMLILDQHYCFLTFFDSSKEKNLMKRNFIRHVVQQ